MTLTSEIVSVPILVTTASSVSHLNLPTLVVTPTPPLTCVPLLRDFCIEVK